MSPGAAANFARRRGTRAAVVRNGMRVVVVGYLVLLIAWPLSLVVRNTFDGGLANLRDILGDPQITHAIRLTINVAKR